MVCNRTQSVLFQAPRPSPWLHLPAGVSGCLSSPLPGLKVVFAMRGKHAHNTRHCRGYRYVTSVWRRMTSVSDGAWKMSNRHVPLFDVFHTLFGRFFFQSAEKLCCSLGLTKGFASHLLATMLFCGVVTFDHWLFDNVWGCHFYPRGHYICGNF